MGVSIRQMRAEDVDEVMEIDRISFADLQEKLSGRPFDLPMRERAFFDFWLRADPEGALVAERDGRIIGLSFNHARARAGWFGPLAVTPSEQSGGAGKAMLRAGLQYLQSAGCELIGLDTYPHNPVAVSIYLKNGFQIVGSTVPLQFNLFIQTMARPEGDGARRIEVKGIRAADLPRIVEAEEQISGFNRRKDFEFFLKWDQAFGLQAIEGSDLVGYLWGYRKRGRGAIGCLYVTDELRYDEIGRPLLAAAFDNFYKLGLNNILCLNDGNQSRQLNFLFHVGFRTQSTMVKLHLGDVQSRRAYSPLATEKG